MVAANAGCAANRKYLGDEIPPRGAPGPLLGSAAEAGANGYGRDPDLGNPVVPWPRTMTGPQLETSAALCDLILPADEHSPAASTLGVHEFIDEWVSAPYETQRGDREVILAGLEWLERQCRDRFDTSFSALDDHRATGILDTIAWPARATAESAAYLPFFARFRYLAVGAFYTTQPGMQDIGYIGNVAIAGDYPGPSAEAMRHLAAVLEQLGLSMPE